jgi:hypothetical protein
MNYRRVLNDIYATETQLSRVNKEASDLHNHFMQYGYYDEHAVEELVRRQDIVHSSLMSLYNMLPHTNIRS